MPTTLAIITDLKRVAFHDIDNDAGDHLRCFTLNIGIGFLAGSDVPPTKEERAHYYPWRWSNVMIDVALNGVVIAQGVTPTILPNALSSQHRSLLHTAWGCPEVS